MATIALQPLEVAGTISGNAPAVVSLPEVASATFLRGAVLTLTAGYVAEAGADPARVLGVAAEPGHNGGSNGLYNTLVYEANDDTVFLGNLSGVASAVTQVGLAYSLVKTGTKWHVDGTDISNRICIIRGFDSRNNIGDTNHLVHFIFHPRVAILHYTS